MARVTPDEVREIMPSTSLSDPALEAAIAAANMIVNKIAAGCASTLTEDELKNVELYLSAHIATNSDPSSSINEEKFENASKKFNVAAQGSGILGTPYGQTANMLSCGCLQELDKRKTNIVALGVSY